MFETIIFKNLLENESCTYYASSHTNACNFITQLENEMYSINWFEGEDFTIEFGDDVNIENISENPAFERVQPGIYKDAE